jgi:hemerythrin
MTSADKIIIMGALMPVLLQANYITPIALNFMDQEHLDEIDLINRLYEILNHDLLMGIIYPEAVKCMKKLLTDTQVHFNNEERLMRETNYPRYEIHRGRHTAFMQKLHDAYNNFVETKNRKDLLIFMEHELKDWFVNHLRTDDYQLAEFSKKNRS